jgi:hypothetical protein
MATRPKFVVPVNAPDEGAFWYVGFSEDWLKVVLAGLLILRDPDLWAEHETSQVIEKIDMLINLLETNLDPPP